MTTKSRKIFTEEEHRHCWQLWRQGLGYSDIAREIASKPGTVFGLIRLNGGFAPPQRLRSQLHLTLLEREEISRGIVQGLTVRTIATQLERSPSTISRELNRNGGVDSYRATKADHKAWKNACRPKPCKLASNAELCEFITDKLKNKWPPQQPSGFLYR